MSDATSRKPGPPLLPPERRRRNKVMLALTDAELGALEAAAAAAGQYVAEFARKRALAAIKKRVRMTWTNNNQPEPNMDTQTTIYTVDEAARLLGVSGQTIRNYLADGRLRPVEVIGKATLVDGASLKQLKEEVPCTSH